MLLLLAALARLSIELKIMSAFNLDFSVLTLSMSLRYLGNELHKLGMNTDSYCIFLKLQGLLWISLCWLLYNTLCSTSCMGSGFYFRHLFGTMSCGIFEIYILYNYITFTSSLEGVPNIIKLFGHHRNLFKKPICSAGCWTPATLNIIIFLIIIHCRPLLKDSLSTTLNKLIQIVK